MPSHEIIAKAIRLQTAITTSGNLLMPIELIIVSASMEQLCTMKVFPAATSVEEGSRSTAASLVDSATFH